MSGFSAKWIPTDDVGCKDRARELAIKRWGLTMQQRGVPNGELGFLYRFRDEEGGDDWLDNVRIRLDAYPILKVTAAGFIIPMDTLRFHTSSKDFRFISNDSNRPWACKTVAGALASFKTRKLSQAHIHRRKMERALEALQLAIPEIGKTDRTKFFGEDF